MRMDPRWHPYPAVILLHRRVPTQAAYSRQVISRVLVYQIEAGSICFGTLFFSISRCSVLFFTSSLTTKKQLTTSPFTLRRNLDRSASFLFPFVELSFVKTLNSLPSMSTRMKSNPPSPYLQSLHSAGATWNTGSE